HQLVRFTATPALLSLPLSLHDALPISLADRAVIGGIDNPLHIHARPHDRVAAAAATPNTRVQPTPLRERERIRNVPAAGDRLDRSEEHTSELQSRGHRLRRRLLDSERR